MSLFMLELMILMLTYWTMPTSIYLLKVNNGNTRTMREICSKLAIVFIVNLFIYCPGVYTVGFEQVNAGWDAKKILGLISKDSASTNLAFSSITRKEKKSIGESLIETKAKKV